LLEKGLSAEKMWGEFEKNYKKYSRVKVWNHLVDFYEYYLEGQGRNVFLEFKQRNRRLFKNYYDRKQIGLSFEEIKAKILKIENEEIRNLALVLLQTGMRFAESQSVSNGIVVGKGGKKRKVFMPVLEGKIYKGPHTKFYRELRKIGLGPHMLRKAAATELANKGLREADLLQVFGWERMDTAKYYLQPRREEELEKMVRSLA
jgi:integrase